MEEYTSGPPCKVPIWDGNHPKVCCPNQPLNYQGEFGSESYFLTKQEKEHIKSLNEKACKDEKFKKCSNGSECRKLNQCGIFDFTEDNPPDICGHDAKSGEDLFCCSDSRGVKIPQEAKFKPLAQCEDQTEMCEIWGKSHPESCSPGHKSYPFMREACYKTCKRCENYVSLYFSVQQ